MKNGEYFLTYRYTNASVEIVVMSGDTQAYKVDICKMLRASFKRPWQQDTMAYDMIDVADENGVITILLENAVMMIMLTISLAPDGTLSVETEWKNTSGEELKDVMLGISIPVKAEDADGIVIPSVCYDEGLAETGDFKCEYLSGGGFVAEEHRLPIPFVCINNVKRAAGNSLALFSVPSKCNLNEDYDSEWSLGIVREEDNISMLLISGGVMVNGQKDFVYGGLNTNVPYERGYFDMPADTEVVKKFAIYCWEADKKSEAFDNVIKKSFDLFSPDNKIQTSYNDFLKYKSIALKNRYVESDDFAGYVKKLSDAHEDMHYTTMSDGWTIDNIAAAWCDAQNSLELRKREGIMHARKCVDFYLNTSKCKKRGLRQLYFDNATMKWRYSMQGDIIPSCEFGLMVSYLADIILLFKEHCLEVPESWSEAFEDSCDFLCLLRKMTKEGIYPQYWTPDGGVGESDTFAGGVTCVSALAKAYSVTGEHQYITVAVKALIKYYECMILRNKLFIKKKKQEDIKSACYDKEAYVYFMTAAFDCYEATRDEKLLKMVCAAAEILMTYVNFVDYPLKRDSKLNKMDFDMRGLSYASRREHALNVIFPSYEMKTAGEITGNALLRKMADITVNAAVRLASSGEGEYGLIAAGEQPEVLYTTNWSESAQTDEWRGGYGDFNTLRSLTWSFRQVLKLSSSNII